MESKLKILFFSSLPGFPIMDLLSMLFNFTFNQTNPDAINACLEIWDEYLDQMAVLEESSLSKVKPSVAYESLLVSLFTASLKKLRLKFLWRVFFLVFGPFLVSKSFNLKKNFLIAKRLSLKTPRRFYQIWIILQLKKMAKRSADLLSLPILRLSQKSAFYAPWIF